MIKREDLNSNLEIFIQTVDCKVGHVFLRIMSPVVDCAKIRKFKILLSLKTGNSLQVAKVHGFPDSLEEVRFSS